MDAVPLQSRPGTKRSRSVSRSSRAWPGEAAPTATQVAPLLVEYCHRPFPPDRPVTAMPRRAPGSASEKASPSRAATVTFAGDRLSSATAGRAGVLSARAGALLALGAVVPTRTVAA